MLSTSLKLDEALAQIVERARVAIPSDRSAIFLYDAATNLLTASVYDSVQQSDPVAHNLGVPASIRLGDGPIGLAAERREPQIVSVAVSNAPGGMHATMAVPILIDSKLIGVFSAECAQPEAFQSRHLTILQTLADHAALLINLETASAPTERPTRPILTRLSEASALLEVAVVASSSSSLDDLLHQVLKLSQNMLGVTYGLFLLYDRPTNTLLPYPNAYLGFAPEVTASRYMVNEPGSRVAITFTGGHPYLANDLWKAPIGTYTDMLTQFKLNNMMLTPLRVEGEPMGVFLVGNKPSDFTRTDATLLTAMGSHIAAALLNADLSNVMSLVSQISRELSATLDLTGLMRKAVHAIHESLRYETVNIMLLDDNDLNLVVRASVSSLPDAALPEGYIIPVSLGIIGRAIRTSQAQVIADIQADADYLELSQTNLVGSMLVIPLHVGSRLIGAMEALTPRLNAFTRTDQTAIETLAAQIAIVIENARLWHQAQRRLYEQDIVHQVGQDLTAILDYNELVNAVTQHLTLALETSLCLLASYDAGQLTVESEYRLPTLADHPLPTYLGKPFSPPDMAVISRVIQSRQPVIEYQAQEALNEQQVYLAQMGIHAQLTLPMIAGDHVIGCIMWVEVRGRREFTANDVRLAQTITSQAAIAIENARLFRQAQRQAREQVLLRRVAVGLSMMADTPTMFTQFAYEIQQALDVDSVMILTRDNAGHFTISASQLATCEPDELLLNHIAETQIVPTLLASIDQGVSVQLKNTALSTETLAELTHYERRRPLTFLIAPILRRRSETIGLIEVVATPPRNFDTRELQLLEALANQGAIAYDNITLREREQRRVHQLETLELSSRNIAGQLQTDRLLMAIVRESARIFRVDAASLMMRTPDNTFYTLRASVGLSERYVRERRRSYVDFEAPIYVNLVSNESPEQAQLIADEDLRSSLSIPLIKAEEQLGVLTLYGKGQPRAFTEEEQELVLLFSSQAAVAIENAALFEALEERALELAKANRLRSEFLTRVSHELRTPMNSINGYSQLLLMNQYGTLNDKQTDRVERIMRNGKTLLTLIDDLLDISSIDGGKMELSLQPLNLQDELLAAIKILEGQATEQGLYLRTEIPDSLPLIQADAARLRQIFTNLIVNALKFTKTGGITIRVQPGESNNHPVLLTSITDTGIGITPEDQRIIFDEFRQVDGSTTREYGGTGLGLAITKKLVDMMAGRIWVESLLGEGSTFTFALPVARERSAYQG